MNLTGRMFGLLIVSAALVSCGMFKKEGKVSAELKRVNSGRSLAMAEIPAAGSLRVTSALAIESLKIPIRGILLKSKGSRTSQIYMCDGATGDDCLVELTGDALDSLIQGGGKEVEEGTYDSLTVATCWGEGSYEAKITASGAIPNLDGTWHTQSGSTELTNDSSLKGEATVYFTGCQREYPLPQPVEVKADKSISVKLYFDITNIAFFADGSHSESAGSSYAGGATRPYDPSSLISTTFAAVNYLDVAATVDEGTPTIKRYLLSADVGGPIMNGALGFFYTSSGDYFGGYSRAVYTSTSTNGRNSFVTPIMVNSDNGDGTFQVANGGSSESIENAYVVVPKFKHEAHSGEVIIQGSAATYTAVLD